MYQTGKGVKKSRKEALKWMTLAANSKFAKAQRKLGYWHEKGYGVRKNSVNGMKWYLIAQSSTKKGRLRELVDKAIARLEVTMSESEMAKAKTLADNFIPGS